MPSSSVPPDPGPAGGPEQVARNRPGASPRSVAFVLGTLVLLAFALPTYFAVVGEVDRYRQVDALNVLWTQWGVETALFLAGGLIAFLLIRISLSVAYRTRPFFLPTTEEDMLFENYRGSFDRYRRQVERVVPVLVSLFVGATAGGQWRRAVLWWHGTTFGASDPYYGKDAGFYVFTLPWLRFLAEFATMCLVLSLLAAVAAHIVNGGISVRGIAVANGRRTTRAARVHLSVLFAVLFLVRAAAATLARYGMVTESGDRFGGMTYTAEHILEPAHAVLAVIAACVAGLFLSVLKTDSLRIPLTSAVVFVVVSVVGLEIAAPLYDHLEVRPRVESLEQVQARQAMTAQGEAFGVANLREGALDVGAVSAGARKDTTAVVAQMPTDTSAPTADQGPAGDQSAQASDRRPKSGNGAITQDDAVARLGRAAPWLTWDHHPYAVRNGSEQLWLVDGYTTTANYPGSQPYQFGATDQAGSGSAGNDAPQGIAANYVRNSVKATVDQRTGAVTMYVWEPKEPILRAWRGVFHPRLLPASRMPTSVSKAVRYPQDLFTVQRDVLSRYHSRSTSDFLQGATWQPALDAEAQPAGVPAAPVRGPIGVRGGKVSTGLSAEFVTRGAHPRLVGLLTASDAGSGPRMSLSTVPTADASDLPDPNAWIRSVQSSTQRGHGTSKTLSEVVLEAEKRANVNFGPVSVLPLDSGLLYVEQVTSTAQTPGAQPKVIAVALRSGRTSVWATSAAQAVDGLFAGEASSATRNGALEDAQQALADANAAQARGDNEAYEEAARRLQAALNRARSARK